MPSIWAMSPPDRQLASLLGAPPPTLTFSGRAFARPDPYVA